MIYYCIHFYLLGKGKVNALFKLSLHAVHLNAEQDFGIIVTLNASEKLKVLKISTLHAYSNNYLKTEIYVQVVAKSFPQCLNSKKIPVF